MEVVFADFDRFFLTSYIKLQIKKGHLLNPIGKVIKAFLMNAFIFHSTLL